MGQPETGRAGVSGNGYRFLAVDPVGSGGPGFMLLPPERTGVFFTNTLPEQRCLTNQILPNGSGVAAADVDGDSWCDLFFCGLGSGGRLYRNLGHWRFEDITEHVGVACPNLDATGAAFADIDGDGDLDLLVNSIGGGTHIFFNDGKGHFTRSPPVLNPGRGGTSLALADADGDGDLDLYIANYRVSTLMDSPGTRFSVRIINGQPVVTMIDGRPLTDPEWTNRFRFKIEMGEGSRGKFAHEELGEPDLFCLNDGKGRFEPVSWTGGAFLDEDGQRLSQPLFDWGLSVMFRDFNGDGRPDLYVCNDFGTPDRIWLNDGHGRFRALPRLAIRQTSLASMAIDVADLNRDGYDDFIVVDMLSREHQRRLVQRNIMRADLAPAGEIVGRPQYPRNTLFLNRGDGTYAEIAQCAGLEASEWSWAPLFLDVDLDGYEDLLVPNGFARDNMNMDAQNAINQAKAGKKLLSRDELLLRRLFPRLATSNLAFRNRGDLRFEEVGREWGFNAATISQGACLADLDNDGDLDVVVNNMNDAAGIYGNDGTGARVGVRLKGRAPNTRGIGAKIRLYGGAVPAQSQEMICGGRYLSSDDTMRVFAAGSLTNDLRIEVTWHSGRHSVVSGARGNRVYEIDEADAPTVREELPTQQVKPMFEDATPRLKHSHTDEPYDDFQRQPLLPKRYSQLGPGVAWWDLDGDGWDDLIVGGGKGGQMAVYRNDRRGGFARSPNSAPPPALTRDQTTVLGWNRPDGKAGILAGSANYEDALVTGPCVVMCEPTGAPSTDAAPGQAASVGPLALGDIDGDGDLDLFVGGRVIAGRYPEPAASRLLRNEGGRFVLDEQISRSLEQAGLVSGAVLSDLNGDGLPELVLACEWGPLRICQYQQGRFTEWNAPLAWPANPSLNSPPSTISQLTGWWNGVTAGDFDGDGRLDIVASNWGANTKYQSHRTRTLRLYYGDFDDNDTVDLLEAYYEPAMDKLVPERMLDTMAKAVPFLAERFPTHESYARASIEEILGEHLSRAKHCEASWLESTVLLNRQDRFEARVLPLEAQLAPAFAVCVGDGDGDGKEDIFLSQNFFAVEMDTSRYDAGRGLWLSGDGKGGFRAVPGQESGVKIYGEQRGAALCDYDADGRVDLVVTQNSAQTVLLRNVRGQPGLRVRLKGTQGNPYGVGSVLRLQYASHLGPAREIHAGSGYWSQDSPVTVLGMGEAPTGLWIRWPGGKTMTVPMSPGTREITVGMDGRVESIK